MSLCWGNRIFRVWVILRRWTEVRNVLIRKYELVSLYLPHSLQSSLVSTFLFLLFLLHIFSFFHDTSSCLFIWPLCLLLTHFISWKYLFCQVHSSIFLSLMCLKPFDGFEVSLWCSVLNPAAVCVCISHFVCVWEEMGGSAGLQCVCDCVHCMLGVMVPVCVCKCVCWGGKQTV